MEGMSGVLLAMTRAAQSSHWLAALLATRGAALNTHHVGLNKQSLQPAMCSDSCPPKPPPLTAGS